jgi:hypothetical protein
MQMSKAKLIIRAKEPANHANHTNEELRIRVIRVIRWHFFVRSHSSQRATPRV